MADLKLMLIRHGESVGNQQGRMEGWGSTPLSSKGQQQAAALGQRLAKSWQPTHIYCSPLLRASETLSRVAVELGWLKAAQEDWLRPDAERLPLPVSLVWAEALKEYQNGVFRGLTWAEAQQRYPDLCRQLETSRDWLPIPQAETLVEGRTRAAEFVRQLLSDHGNGDRIWVISHHWMLQQLISVLMGCDRTWGFPISHTGLFEFWLNRERWQANGPNRWNSELWQVKKFNDCQHLHR